MTVDISPHVPYHAAAADVDDDVDDDVAADIGR